MLQTHLAAVASVAPTLYETELRICLRMGADLDAGAKIRYSHRHLAKLTGAGKRNVSRAIALLMQRGYLIQTVAGQLKTPGEHIHPGQTAEYMLYIPGMPGDPADLSQPIPDFRPPRQTAAFEAAECCLGDGTPTPTAAVEAAPRCLEDGANRCLEGSTHPPTAALEAAPGVLPTQPIQQVAPTAALEAAPSRSDSKGSEFEKIDRVMETRVKTTDIEPAAEALTDYRRIHGCYGAAPAPPDVRIVRQVLAAAGGLASLYELLKTLHSQAISPGQSYAWFVAVALHRFHSIDPAELRRYREARRKPPTHAEYAPAFAATGGLQ